MTEVSKSRLALDLEEIERQLRHSAQQPGSLKSDPLAELARIVGQDDPFGVLLGSDKRAPSGAAVGMDDIFVRREPLFEDPGQGSRAGLRGAAPAQPHAYQDFSAALTAEEQAILHGQYDPRYAAAPDDADLYYEDGSAYAQPESTFAPLERRRSRKGMIALGAVLGAAALGTAAVVLLQPATTIGVATGVPPVVKADAGPSKVPPQNPGGLDIPNQNKQIYERAPQDTQTRVVNREEQPIDVRQATRPGGALSEGLTASAPVRMSPAVPAGPSAPNGLAPALPGTGPAAANGVLGEPRRVRTVSIRPDGTMITSEQGGNGRPAAAPPAPIAMPRMEAPAGSALPPGPAASAPAGAPGGPARMPPPQRPRDVTSTPAPPRAGSGATAADPAPGAPLQITSDALRTKSDARLAAAPQAIMREPTETSAAPVPAGFSVQLGIRNTEREGRAMFDQLQQRFAGELSGHSPMFRQAEINGKPAYRVRVGPMSREEAVSLCSRLKASGGQCFVANN